MRAVLIQSLDGPDSARVQEVPEPQHYEKVLIEVHAAGVTFPELLLSRGEYQLKPNLPFIPGSEVAGVVLHAPKGSGFETGDRVAGFPIFGGYAEKVAVEPHAVFPLPDSVSFVAGAALPMNYLTAHFALARRGRLKSGESVLVHGAAGGIGTATIQVARAMGAEVIAVASSAEKRELAIAAGAHHAVAVEDFRTVVSGLTEGRGVDVVVDPVGGDRFTDSVRSLRPEGRLLVVGFTAGEIPTVRANRLLLNNVDVVGVGWGAFWMPRVDYLREQWTEILPLIESGILDPVLGDPLTLDQASVALRQLDARSAFGKLVLTTR